MSKPLDYLNQTAHCPDCDSPSFILGPEGGMAVNIRCAGCGHKFWFAPPFTPERINNDDQFYRRSPVNLWDEVYGAIERPVLAQQGRLARLVTWLRAKVKK
jgi:hypothetical protein